MESTIVMLVVTVITVAVLCRSRGCYCFWLCTTSLAWCNKNCHFE